MSTAISPPRRSNDVPASDQASGASQSPGHDPRPTVCQVLHGLPVGGAEMLAFRLAGELRDSFRFVFACLDQVGELGEKLRDEGFPMHLLGRSPGLDVRTIWRLARLLRRERVDVVHAHQYTPFFYALSTRVLGRGRPLLFTEHGRWHPDFPRRKRIIFNRLMLRRRDRVVGVGRSVGRALIDNEGIPEPHVAVIYNGIDVERFHVPDRESVRRTVRAECGIDQDAFLVIQVARLDHLKDHVTAVRTVAQLAAHVPQVRLLIVGDGPERQPIEREIARHGAGGRIVLAGIRHDIPRLLAAADAFLLTSISEGIPLTIIEAMAASLPVVSTSVGGVPEVVLDGETGWLAPAGNAEALASALVRLRHDAGQARRMGEAGRDRAREFFSERQNHDAYRSVYREMLDLDK